MTEIEAISMYDWVVINKSTQTWKISRKKLIRKNYAQQVPQPLEFLVGIDFTIDKLMIIKRIEITHMFT